jgi:hypothetical protein
MDVDDPVVEGIDKGLRVDSVVACEHHELDPVVHEEVTHRPVAFVRRGETLLRQLAERDALLSSEGSASARRPVCSDCDDV